MSRQPGQYLLKVVVQPVHAVLLAGGHAFQPTLPHQQPPQRLADGRVVGDDLRDDVVRPLQCVRYRLHALLRVDVVRGGLRRVGAVRPLRQQPLRQRRKPFLPGRRGPGAALLLVGPVQILHLRQRGGALNGGGQLLRELALPVDGGQHLLPALGQITQIAQPVLQLPQGGVVHSAVKLLAVAGDERDGVALVQQGDDIFHMAQGLVQLPGQQLGNSRHGNASPFRKL